MIRTGPPDLRADRIAAAACSASANAAPSVRGTRSRLRICSGSGTRRPGPIRAPRPMSGSWLTRQQFGHIGRGAGQGGHPGDRREPQLLAVGQLAIGRAGRIPANQRLDRRERRVGTEDHRPVRGDQGDRVGPAPHGLLGRAQVGPAEQRPAVQQQGGAVTAVDDRLRARSGHHQGRRRPAPRTAPPHRRWCAGRCRETRGPAPRPSARRRPARPAARCPAGRAAPAGARAARTSGSSAWPPARAAASGPPQCAAPGRLAVLGTGQRRQVTPPRAPAPAPAGPVAARSGRCGRPAPAAGPSGPAGRVPARRRHRAPPPAAWPDGSTRAVGG